MVTRIDPDQVKTPPFDDSLTPGPGLESGAVDTADALDGIMSMLRSILGEANWYDTPDEAINLLAARAKLEDKMALKRAQLLADVTVPNGQNYVALGVGEIPSGNKALNSGTRGAVTAQLAGAIGSWDATEVAGANALTPKNLVQIVDATTQQQILSDGRRVYGLLQVGSLATNGTPFASSGNEQPQISFMRPNSGYTDLEACPVADIQNKVINYSYIFRDDLYSLSEQAFLPETLFADSSEAPVVSLDEAYQGGSIVNVDDTLVEWRLTDNKEFLVTDSTGAAKILRVRALAAGDLIELNVPGGLDLNGDLDAGTYKASINGVVIGTVAGQIERTGGTLTLKTITSGNVVLDSVAEVQFKSSRESGVYLDDATAGPISGLTGGPHASIAAAIKYAMATGGVPSLGVTTLGSNYARDVNVPGGAGQSIASPHSIDMNTPSGVDTFIFLNGRLLYGGNGTTNNDVYAGDTPANGDLKFDFPTGVKTGDVIISLQFS